MLTQMAPFPSFLFSTLVVKVLARLEITKNNYFIYKYVALQAVAKKCQNVR